VIIDHIKRQQEEGAEMHNDIFWVSFALLAAALMLVGAFALVF
jgi:hypothetical protein